ncbi:MAG: glycosyltransferase family 2 protein [Candidatus Rokubacteria bacterium]|nr:glycosyltransferase family 2 protein [Candidatus Rokubacteria bacterium]
MDPELMGTPATPAPHLLSLVIPLYNEADNIDRLVKGLMEEFDRQGLEYELILVNNGSHDSTPVLLEEWRRRNRRVRVVTVEVNRGYGAGIQAGLRVATGNIVGFMDGDCQVLAEDVTRVYRQLIADGLDLAKVRRVIRKDGAERRIISSCFNILFELMFRTGSRDINGKPKLMRRPALESLNLQSRDWFLDAEIMVKCGAQGRRIGEVPAVFLQREKQRSHIQPATILEFLKNMWRYWVRAPHLYRDRPPGQG